MLRLTRGLMLIASALAGASPVLSDNSKYDIWSECRSANSCSIEYDYLSNQKTDPFLFLGRVVNDEHPQWRTYQKTLRRHPDVESCLAKEERNERHPNLLHVDWAYVGTSRGAEICLFRIASSLGSIERIVEWLEYQGFRHRGLNRSVSPKFKPHFETQPVADITASWTAERYREISPSWLSSLTGYDLINSYLLVLSFDQNDKISGVDASARTKLN